jgi:hypothetical protein
MPRVASTLLLHAGMVETIIRITMVAVLAVGLMNLAHGAWIAFRFGRHTHLRYPEIAKNLWFPIFQSRRDVAVWLATWRSILGSGDPMLALLRAEGRTVMTRHLQLLGGSQGWALVLHIVVPTLA